MDHKTPIINESLEQGVRLNAAAGKEGLTIDDVNRFTLEQLKSEKRQEAYNFPDCITCQRRIESGKFYGPAHTPSPRCRSGKRDHCSCDICY